MRDQPRPLRTHLEEARRRLLWSVMAFAVGVGLAAAFYEPIVRVLLLPAQDHLSLSTKPIFTEVTEVLGVVVRTALLGGAVVGLPVFAYQLTLFVAPALNQAERRLALLFVPVAFLFFAGGVTFAYFILLPPGLRFLLTFGSQIATPMIRLGSYVNLVVTLLFWVGLVFETPLVMLLLAKLRIVSHRGFARGRRYALVGAFLLGAVITPTFDPLNQSLVAVPMLLLYEVGIWLAWLVRPREAQAVKRAGEAGA